MFLAFIPHQNHCMSHVVGYILRKFHDLSYSPAEKVVLPIRSGMHTKNFNHGLVLKSLRLIFRGRKESLPCRSSILNVCFVEYRPPHLPCKLHLRMPILTE